METDSQLAKTPNLCKKLCDRRLKAVFAILLFVATLFTLNKTAGFIIHIIPFRAPFTVVVIDRLHLNMQLCNIGWALRMLSLCLFW